MRKLQALVLLALGFVVFSSQPAFANGRYDGGSFGYGRDGFRYNRSAFSTDLGKPWGSRPSTSAQTATNPLRSLSPELSPGTRHTNPQEDLRIKLDNSREKYLYSVLEWCEKTGRINCTESEARAVRAKYEEKLKVANNSSNSSNPYGLWRNYTRNSAPRSSYRSTNQNIRVAGSISRQNEVNAGTRARGNSASIWGKLKNAFVN